MTACIGERQIVLIILSVVGLFLWIILPAHLHQLGEVVVCVLCCINILELGFFFHLHSSIYFVGGGGGGGEYHGRGICGQSSGKGACQMRRYRLCDHMLSVAFLCRRAAPLEP